MTALMTVQELADRFQVSTTIIRYWIKNGYLNYTYVGPRHLIALEDAVKPIEIEHVQPEEVTDGDSASGHEGSGPTEDHGPGSAEEGTGGGETPGTERD